MVEESPHRIYHALLLIAWVGAGKAVDEVIAVAATRLRHKHDLNNLVQHLEFVPTGQSQRQQHHIVHD